MSLDPRQAERLPRVRIRRQSPSDHPQHGPRGQLQHVELAKAAGPAIFLLQLPVTAVAHLVDTGPVHHRGPHTILERDAVEVARAELPDDANVEIDILHDLEADVEAADRLDG